MVVIVNVGGGLFYLSMCKNELILFTLLFSIHSVFPMPFQNRDTE